MRKCGLQKTNVGRGRAIAEFREREDGKTGFKGNGKWSREFSEEEGFEERALKYVYE